MDHGRTVAATPPASTASTASTASSPTASSPAASNPASSSTVASSKATAAQLLAALTLEQKIGLLTGADNFSLAGHAPIGLRRVVMSDGPAGVRGTVMDPADRSSSLPAPIALAATWDPDLVERVAAQLGVETRAKGVDVLLAPTVNLVRTPFGGRGFECFGEDPVLAARTAAAYVRGLQSAGVAATAKHYAGNDSETDRWNADARIDETTLRELYLVPFEACVTEADAAAVMAGYNKVNGITMTEHTELLRRILKGEWGFAGAVVSDWFAARSTEATALAGLDLVMPGPDGPWGGMEGGPLAKAVARGAVPESEIDDKVLRLLRLAHRVGALGGGAGSDHTPRTRTMADREVLREAAAASFVLLRNAPAVLPLAPGQSIALIGPNAVLPQYQGLGSAQVGLAVQVSPEEGLRAALPPGAALVTAAGCRTWLNTPLPAPGQLSDPSTGQPGARLEVRGEDGVLRHCGVRETPEVTWWDPRSEITGPGVGLLTFRTSFVAQEAGPHRFAAAGLGKLELRLGRPHLGGGGSVGTNTAAATDTDSTTDTASTTDTTVRGEAPDPVDPVEPLSRPFEIGAELDLEPGDRVEVFASCDPTSYANSFTRFKVGIVPMPSEDALIARAVAAAGASDVAVVVVGSPEGLESEGYDRAALGLPGRQDELIAAVAAANPRTVVVLNSGMPMLMPWADRVAAIVQAWFPGQEFGHALADVLLGAAEPGGRLPVTMPRTEAACPVGPAIPSDGRLDYSEGLLVGYRGYDAAGTEPLFPFGHGLGYTSWAYEELDVPVGIVRAHADVEVTLTVRNIGTRPGRETVQVYLSGPQDNAGGGAEGRPVRVLAGLARAYAEPGEAAHVRLRLPSRAFARWDAQSHAWVHPHGRYSVQVGRSSRDLRLVAQVDIG